MRVLYVENDPACAKKVELMLKGVVDRCDTTSLGEYAFQLARRNDYDLVLLDVMLPDIDGFELLRRLRSAGVYTPYLILSGLVDRDSDFSALAFGVGDYLVKPFTKDELVDRVQAARARKALNEHGTVEDAPSCQAAVPKDGVERRSHRRFRTIKTAKIDHGPGIDCKILNMSHGGAAIRLPDDHVDLPPSFLLKMDDGVSHVCKVRWRDGKKVGVKFLGRGD
ncbi:MAG: response regulator [Planctomycetota bacterium]|jgi:DNA-binding response OmpR family regulator